MKNKLLLCALLLAGVQAMSKLSAQCQAGFTFSVSGSAVTFNNTSQGAGSPTYYWDFGDNTSGHSQNPVHSYNSAGTYYVCLTYADSSVGSCSSSFCDSLVITVGCNTIAVVPSGTDPSSASACDGAVSVSASGGVTPYTYAWSPNVSNGQSAANLCNGCYGITVTDAMGCTGTTIMCIQDSTPANTTCQAAFTQTNSQATFNFTNTSTGTNSNTYYAWNFGDGTYSTSQNPVHTYSYNGTYNVCLSLGDSLQACYSTYCTSVVITGAANQSCSASIQLIQDSANSSSGLWHLYPTVTGTAPFTYLWNFGDGNTSTLAYPSHSYAVPGHYNICLTITDATGCSSTTCDSTYKLALSGMIQHLVVVDPTGTTGIQENTISVNSIFPNPASDVVSISLSELAKGNLTITDMIGREVYTENINSNNVKVNVSNLPIGYYNLSIVSGSKATHEKIMIAR